MRTLALKITPQRSTQYANMTEKLAGPELLASPLGAIMIEIKPVAFAGQTYLLVSLDNESMSSQCFELQEILPRLGATSEAYEFFERVGDVEGPFLRPVETTFVPFLPLEMAEIRRYKGKTNELFTSVLLNIAVFAGAFTNQYTGRLRILDPLAGGGTTLFLALSDGYDAFGIEHQKQDVDTTVVFLRQYLNSIHMPYKELDERGRRIGRRYQFEIGHKGVTRRLVLAHGDTCDAKLHMQEVPGGPHMHAIVGDLPYGIQHFGEIAGMLSRALPVWVSMLLPGGTIALAWNATRIERTAMIGLIEQHTHLQIRNDPPYTQFVHTVDRVIKKRDILVAVKS
jgi:hypothetical protein